LAAAVAGPLSAAEVDELYRRAGGHPVFTRELALLAREGRGGHLVPVAVRDAIEHRLDGLPNRTRGVLEVAALAGRAIALDVLAAAISVSRSGIDAALAEDRLVGIAGVDVDDRLQFAHDLYRETIAASIPGDRRAALHQQLAIALAERAAGGLPVQPADLAHHFTAAVPVGEASRAAQWSLTAANADVESLAFVEAAAHLTRWREAVVASPVAVDPREYTTVLVAEADALARAGMVDEARGRLRSARDLTAPEPFADLRAEVALAVADLGARASTRRDEVLQGLEEALAAV
jgi:predicted ATPase